MRRKILSMVTVVMMLFMAVGCGGDSASTQNSVKSGTEVSVQFKNSTNNYQKISDIYRVRMNVKKGNTFIYENKPLTKTLGKWGVNLNLNANNGPYTFETTAYDSGENLLYRGIYETDSILSNNLVLSLNDVSQNNIFSLPPYLKSIEVYSENEKEARVRFTVKNFQKDTLQYKLNVTSETVKPNKVLAKGDNLPILGCANPEIGCFKPNSGTLSFGDKDEVTFISIYTKPISITLAKTTSTDLGLGGGSLTDIIKTSLTLENTQGNIVTVPFTFSSYDEQLITINLPPEIQKINVIDETTDFTLTAEVLDEDSSSWTYEWSEIIGANIVGTTATKNPLKLEGYDSDINPNLCVNLKVTDNGGASSSIDYCIRRENFIRVGETVIDENTGLQWQDNEDVKNVKLPWITQENYDAGNYGDRSGDTAFQYCINLEIDNLKDWRLPTRNQLLNIADDRFKLQINPIFKNHYPGVYYTGESERGAGAYGVDFMPNSLHIKAYTLLFSENKAFHVRCVRGK